MGKRAPKNAAGDPDTNPEDAPEVQTAPEPQEAGEDAGDGKNEVVVKFRDHQGEVVSRSFSKEVHGKDFKKLAAEFRCCA